MIESSDYKTQALKKEDKNYPKNLARIKNSPKTLFYKGNPKVLHAKRSIAVVGSRRMTRYGKETVDRFISAFVSQNVVIISGFMYGADSEAHRKTIEYGGKTIAVFGCGLDVCYPPENEKLYASILKTGGTLVSEYKDGMKPQLWTFPARNRIVAGLSSLGVLVIEAGDKSGSLITAKLAKEMRRPVWAVPGPITSSVSIGCNWLIKSGEAKMATEPGDIIGSVKNQGIKEQKINLSKTERMICEALQREPLNIDEIAARLGEGVIEVGKTISLMSLKGLVAESAGKFYYSRAK